MKPSATQFLIPAARTVVTAVALLATLALARPVPAAPDARSRTDRVEARITMLPCQARHHPGPGTRLANPHPVMRANEQTMEALTKARADHAQTLTAVDDLKSYAEITTAHARASRNSSPPLRRSMAACRTRRRPRRIPSSRAPAHRPAAKKLSKAQNIPSASTATSTK